MRRNVTHHQIRSSDIDRHHAIPKFRIPFVEVSWLQARIERGIVHQNIDMTEAIDRLCHQILHRLLIANIEFHARNGIRSVAAGNFLGKLTAVSDVRNHHTRAFGGKRLRVVPSDTLCTTRDDCSFSSKPRHNLVLRLAPIMPALVAGIHVLQDRHHRDVGRRNKPGHDRRGHQCLATQPTVWRSGR
jgi:hypothetical protein